MALSNFSKTKNSITVSLVLYSFICKSLTDIKDRFSGVIQMTNNIGDNMKLIKCEDVDKKFVTYECHYDKNDFEDNDIEGDILLFFRRTKDTSVFNLKDCVETFLKNNKTDKFFVHGIIIADSKTNSILCYKVIDNNDSFIVDEDSCTLNVNMLDVTKEIDFVKEKLKNNSSQSTNNTEKSTNSNVFSIQEKEKKIIDKGVESMV